MDASVSSLVMGVSSIFVVIIPLGLLCVIGLGLKNRQVKLPKEIGPGGFTFYAEQPIVVVEIATNISAT